MDHRKRGKTFLGSLTAGSLIFALSVMMAAGAIFTMLVSAASSGEAGAEPVVSSGETGAEPSASSGKTGAEPVVSSGESGAEPAGQEGKTQLEKDNPQKTASSKKAGKKSPVKSPVLKYVDWASYSQLSLRWTRVKGADGYLVQRSDRADGKYKKMTLKKGEKSLRAILKAKRGKVCYYRVKAFRKIKGKRVYSQPSEPVCNVKYKDSPLGELFPKGPPKREGQMRRKYLTWVKVVVWTGKKKRYMTIPVHKKLKKKVKRCFREMYRIRFPIDTRHTWSFAWRKMRSVDLRSHHSYGCVVDLNWNDNPMVSLSRIKSCSYKPGRNKYSITARVVKIWEKEGFFWGGNWPEKKDFMHMTYTNN